MLILRVGVLVLLTTRFATAMFVDQPFLEYPVERLILNQEAVVKTDPELAMGHYTLGRLHFLAYSTKHHGQLPSISLIPLRPSPGNESHQAQHLTSAVAELETAVRLEPQNPLFHLTYASVLEKGSRDAGIVRKGNTEVKWIDAAVNEYLTAHKLAWRGDSALTKRYDGPIGFSQLTSEEAGDSYIRLARQRGLRTGEQELAGEIEQRIRHLGELPRAQLITPIILSLTLQTSLDSLLDPTLKSTFDLDGTGCPQLYPWLRPTTGLLVWDPKHTGLITSGRQLFGSVTWWMFWNTGYDALAALDDNHDGCLTGPELEGLAVWFDRNQNGRSDPGEVIPVSELGIEAINVGWDARDGESWKSTRGIRLKNGSFLPTWDWVVEGQQSRPQYGRPPLLVSARAAPDYPMTALRTE